MKIFHSFLFICLDRGENENANIFVLFGWGRNRKVNFLWCNIKLKQVNLLFAFHLLELGNPSFLRGWICFFLSSLKQLVWHIVPTNQINDERFFHNFSSFNQTRKLNEGMKESLIHFYGCCGWENSLFTFLCQTCPQIIFFSKNPHALLIQLSRRPF